ncbi:MAG TPA: helix-turn-helix domain-containing protein [Kofleriaceae bacterium]
MNLAAWLRAGRDRRKLTIEDVARITKIQVKILEKLERGELDGLPAAVFVKGFVRSFAKCVGLDENEALEKYGAAVMSSGLMSSGEQPAVAAAKAFVETMARPVDLAAVVQAKRVRIGQGTPVEPAPVIAAPSAEPVIETPVEVAPAIEATTEAPLVIETPLVIDTPEINAIEASEGSPEPGQPAKKKRARKNAKQRNRKRKQAQQVAPIEDAVETAVFEKQAIDTAPIAVTASSGDGESLEATSIEAKTSDAIVETTSSVIEDGAVESQSLAEGSQRISQTAIAVEAEAIDVPAEASVEVAVEPAQSHPNKGDEHAEMCTGGDDTAGTWQPTMPPIAATASVPWRRPSMPTSTASAYVVPSLVIDDSDPDSADRERDDRSAKEPTRLSFLPPILLDREDRSARQGGLTVAVIILLIAATLTLSYLMRRPSPSGDGVTMYETKTAAPASLQA